MRCYICNAILNEPKMNPDVGNYDPCDTCMSIIEDTVAGFTDKPAADEDAFTTADPPLVQTREHDNWEYF